MADLDNPLWGVGGGGYYDVATTVTSYYFWKFDAHILKD